MMDNRKSIIIIGASSGIGRRLAIDYAARGYRVGVAARREQALRELVEHHGIDRYAVIDITSRDAAERFNELASGMDNLETVIHAAGCGWMNPTLDPDREMRTVETNVVGFTAIIDAAYTFFRKRGHGGHIAAITSLAGTRGLAPAPAYSATKRFGSEYLRALTQLARNTGSGITVTDIRPGFIDTDLLDTSTHSFPMLMSLDKAVPLIERAIDSRRAVCVTGWRWRMLYWLWRMVPDFVWRRLPLTRFV